MSNEAATLKLAEKVAQNFPTAADQKRFLEQVQNRVAAKVEKGYPTPQVKVREAHQVKTAPKEHTQQR